MNQTDGIPVTAPVIDNLIHPHILTVTEPVGVNLLREMIPDDFPDLPLRHSLLFQFGPLPFHIPDCIIHRRPQILLLILQNRTKHNLRIPVQLDGRKGMDHQIHLQQNDECQ